MVVPKSGMSFQLNLRYGKVHQVKVKADKKMFTGHIGLIFLGLILLLLPAIAVWGFNVSTFTVLWFDGDCCCNSSLD